MNRIEQIHNFLKDNPTEPFLNHALALEYLKIDDMQSALECFQKNRSNNPTYVATYYHLGKLLEKLEDEAEALKIYEEGITHAKAQNDAHNLRELMGAYDNLAY